MSNKKPFENKLRRDIPPPQEEGRYVLRFVEPGDDRPHSERVSIMKHPETGEWRVVRYIKDPPYSFYDGHFKLEDFATAAWRPIKNPTPLPNPAFVSWKGSVERILRKKSVMDGAKNKNDVQLVEDTERFFQGKETGTYTTKRERGYAEGANIPEDVKEELAKRRARAQQEE